MTSLVSSSGLADTKGRRLSPVSTVTPISSWSIKCHHRFAALQNERLVLLSHPHDPFEQPALRLIPNTRIPSPSHNTPCQNRAHTIIRDARCLLWVGEQRCELILAIAQVELDLVVVLGWTGQDQLGLVMMDRLQPVCDDRRAAFLAADIQYTVVRVWIEGDQLERRRVFLP
ncbi:hypothetical protein BJX63DRAFT_274522 [Aspergillus granulosus]|uniref:Uncharacterized protein n=1 Tax=Aspergillus granulosus TaxID=176169 RepID=A0ABR4H815_9EURO